jgi:hypothetical protein
MRFSIRERVKTRGSALFTPYNLPMDLLAFHSLPVDVFLLGDILA